MKLIKQNIHNFKYRLNTLLSSIIQSIKYNETKVLSQLPIAEFVVILLTYLFILGLQYINK